MAHPGYTVFVREPRPEDGGEQEHLARVEALLRIEVGETIEIGGNTWRVVSRRHELNDLINTKQAGPWKKETVATVEYTVEYD